MGSLQHFYFRSPPTSSEGVKKSFYQEEGEDEGDLGQILFVLGNDVMVFTTLKYCDNDIYASMKISSQKLERYSRTIFADLK